jgi:cytoskeletal protein CcmA (bactofilin family)
MKKLGVISALVAVAVTAVGYLGAVSAQTFRTGDNVNFPVNQTVDSTIFTSGRTVNIAGTVNGDIFCAGQTVTISAQVNGDIICAAQNINVTGTVQGSVRLAGQMVVVDSSVDGSATIASQSFTLGSKGEVGRDLSVGTSDTALNGKVGRDLAAAGANIVVANEIGRNIKGTVDQLKLDSTADVKGNIDYTSSNDLERASGATVDGTISRSDPPQDSKASKGNMLDFGFAWFAYCLIAFLVIALTLILAIPEFVHRSSDKVLAKPYKAPLIGLAVTLLGPIVLIILAFTVVGIPLAILLGLIWLVILLLSGPFFAYLVGRLILRRSNQALLIMLVGALVVLVAYFIPIIGFLVMLAAVWVGTGMIVLELLQRTQRPQYKVAEVSGVSIQTRQK